MTRGEACSTELLGRRRHREKFLHHSGGSSATGAFRSACSVANRKQSPLPQGDFWGRGSRPAGLIFSGHWAIILLTTRAGSFSDLVCFVDKGPKARKYEVTYLMSHCGNLWPIAWALGKKGPLGNLQGPEVKA